MLHLNQQQTLMLFLPYIGFCYAIFNIGFCNAIFDARVNQYNNIEVHIEKSTTTESFEEELKSSLKKWKSNGHNAAW